FEVNRAVGIVSHLLDGSNGDPPGWQTSSAAQAADCAPKVGDLFVVKYADVRATVKTILLQQGMAEGPGLELLLRSYENIDHMLIGTYQAPFLIQGGPWETDPEASFDLNFTSGQGVEGSDTVPFWMVVPKETAQFKQPFDVNIYGHGVAGNFSE